MPPSLPRATRLGLSLSKRLDLTDRYIVITTDFRDRTGDFTNTALGMIEAYGLGPDPIPIVVATRSAMWHSPRDFRSYGMEFDSGFGQYLGDLGRRQRDRQGEHPVALGLGRRRHRLRAGKERDAGQRAVRGLPGGGEAVVGLGGPRPAHRRGRPVGPAELAQRLQRRAQRVRFQRAPDGGVPRTVSASTRWRTSWCWSGCRSYAASALRPSFARPPER